MKKIELPEGFKSWSEVYASIENAGLIEFPKVVMMPRTKDLPDIYARIETKEYYVSDIKDALLEELWEEKKDTKGLDIDDLLFIAGAVNDVAMKYGSGSMVLDKVHKAISNLELVLGYKVRT